MKYVMLFSLIFVIPALGWSATLYVPGGQPTIQKAIDAAAITGDTVIVAGNTYYEHINFLGKAVHVKSLDGPLVTVIDGSQTGRPVTIDQGEGPDAILEGFTITNGVEKFGGGLMIYTSHPTIRGNIVCHNIGTPYYGGGMYCRGANPVITDNIFYENKADERGGGVMNYASSPVMTNNVFYGNKSFTGGGVQCEYNSGAIITNNTFYENEAVSDGGGLFVTKSSSVLVSNSIFWENSALVGTEISIGDSTNPSTLDISYTDIQGGKAGIYVEAGCTLIWGSGMMDMNPLFVDTPGHDYHILYGSPCRDAGFNGAPAIPPKDFEGDPRMAEQAADMGADEFHTHLYFTGDPTPSGTVQIKLVGWPGVAPVGLFIGSGVLDPPLPTIYGDWYLKWPVALIGPLGPMPANGYFILTALIPSTPPPPYSLPMQALIWMGLTNVCVMHVQ